MPAERVRAILDERARALARQPAESPAAGELLEVVTFTLGNDRYAIETKNVREILRFKEHTPLPGAPAFLIGIANLRGQIVAVFDLGVFLGIAHEEGSDLSWMVVLGAERIEFGICADAVHDVALVPIHQVQAAPESVARIAREHVRGVTADGLILLNGEALLKDPRLYIDLGDSSDR